MSNPRSEYTPEKVAELANRLRGDILDAVPDDGDMQNVLDYAADALTAISAERDAAIRDLDAGFAESDHLSAKYYQRMRDAEREMHARELHHFEEEKRSADLEAELRREREQSQILATELVKERERAAALAEQGTEEPEWEYGVTSKWGVFGCSDIVTAEQNASALRRSIDTGRETVEKLRELWFWRWGAMDQTTNHEIRRHDA